MLGQNRINRAGDGRQILKLVRGFTLSEAHTVGLENNRHVSFGRCHRIVESLAGLVGFPSLLQAHHLFDDFNARSALNSLVQHVHRRQRNRLLRDRLDFLFGRDVHRLAP